MVDKDCFLLAMPPCLAMQIFLVLTTHEVHQHVNAHPTSVPYPLYLFVIAFVMHDPLRKQVMTLMTLQCLAFCLPLNLILLEDSKALMLVVVC